MFGVLVRAVIFAVKFVNVKYVYLFCLFKDHVEALIVQIIMMMIIIIMEEEGKKEL